MDADRDLRFALAALDRGLINAAQLAELEREWLASRARPLADLAIERGWISEADRSTIDAVLDSGSSPTHPALEDDRSTVLVPRSVDRAPSPVPPPRPPSRSRAEAPDFGERYVEVAFHAQGGIGTVYRARDVVLNRKVAIKVLRDGLDDERRASRRFREEARITARLQHPNIVPTHDLVDRPGQLPLYTMRFLDGPTLKSAAIELHRDKDGGRTDSQAFRRLLDAFLGTCDAIAYAHSQRVIHRDLKGLNIILGPFGESFVLDWGLAREVDAEEDPLARPTVPLDELPDEFSRTIEGYPLGTMQYMPPEQADGRREAIGFHSDVFGLGAILYLILTGQPPYQGGTNTEILRKARSAEFPRPSALNPRVPKSLEAICLRAMEKDPAKRYGSPVELSDEVKRWMADEPVRACPDGAAAKVARWSRKHQPIVAGAAALLLTAAVGFGVGAWLVGQESLKVEAEALHARTERDRAKAGFDGAIQVIDGVLGVIVQDLPHVRDPALDSARLKAADTVTRFADGLTAQELESPNARIALAAALRESAKAYELPYRFADAQRLLLRGIAICSDGKPDEALAAGTRVAAVVAEMRGDLARIHLQLGDPKGADAHASRVVAWADRTRPRSPGDATVERIAAMALLNRGDAAEARGAFSESAKFRAEAGATFAKLRDGRSAMPTDALMAVIAQVSQGVALAGAGRLGDAKTTLEAVGADVPRLRGLVPDADARHVAAVAKFELARVLILQGDDAGAARLLDDGLIAEFARIAAERPSVLGFAHDSACARIIRADLIGRGDELAGAEADLAAIVKQSPAALPSRAWHARALAAMAEFDAKAGDQDAARRRRDQAAADLGAVLAANPQDPVAHRAQKRFEALGLSFAPAPLAQEK